ncbi:MAG: hypothetical protein ABDH29_05130 [Aquificaceae bacterium]
MIHQIFKHLGQDIEPIIQQGQMKEVERKAQLRWGLLLLIGE